MLVLSRREGEALWIDGEIEVRVLAIGEGKVRIGIGAPDEMKIVREELIDLGGDPGGPAGDSEQIGRRAESAR